MALLPTVGKEHETIYDTLRDSTKTARINLQLSVPARPLEVPTACFVGANLPDAWRGSNHNLAPDESLAADNPTHDEGWQPSEVPVLTE